MSQPLSKFDLSQLGEFHSEYPAGSGRHLLAGCCVIGLMLFFAGMSAFFIFYRPHNASTGRFWVALAFGVLALIPFLGLLILLRRLTWRVYLFENGFVIERGQNVEQFLWYEIKCFCETRIILEHAMESDHQISIETDSGRKLTLDASFTNIDALIHAISDAVNPLLLERAEESLAANMPIPFGKLQLTNEGLNNGKKMIAWHDVASVKIEPDQTVFRVVIRQSNRKAPWFSQSVPSFPNLEVFLALANTFVQTA